MATPRICSIPNCGKKHRSRGFCDNHYTRWLKYGSPVAGRVAQIKRGAQCLTQGCERLGEKRGRCSFHYWRFKKYGDATMGKAPRGEAQRYFRETVLQYTGEECLIWPFLRSENGYGTIWWKKRQTVASRVACEEIHGEPPAPNYQAAHSCGNGHLGCVNPRHLRWATPIENSADAALHGTRSRGSKVGTSKLKEGDVAVIRAMAESGQSHYAIARHFGVTRENIRDIVRRRLWGWLV